MYKIKHKKIVFGLLSLFSVCGVSLGLIFSLNNQVETDATVTTYSYNSDSPFFNDYFDSFSPDNTTSIDKWFDTLPQTSNYSNFCSLGTASYANINGKTVTVDVFNRNYLDSLDDPNFGEGMLIYQCIQYKVAHPEENVSISFSSYRVSITASLCLKRDSIYFGYMRSLFDEEYDSHGFVRICFMLVEAARMGINVTFIPHINAYGVRQNASNSKGYATKNEPSFTTYFNDALNKSCYSTYANGKKVSSFLKYKKVGWDVDAFGGTDMMHTKMCLVSNYTDYLGQDHDYGVYMTSSNLDANDYLGRNGNGWGQTGLIISNHEKIYQVSRNYLNLINNNCEIFKIDDFKRICREMNESQMELILNGRMNEISDDSLIIYPGSESDNIFEMYFSPFGGGLGMWNSDLNPYVKYISKFSKGNGPFIFTWNTVNYNPSGSFKDTIERIISNKFHENPSLDNRLYLHLDNFKNSEYFDDLLEGNNIGYKKIELSDVTKIHSKDMIFSYNEGDTRQYISIMSSCNFHMGALYAQANQTLVIHETDDTGHNFYDLMGRATTKGCIN